MAYTKTKMFKEFEAGDLTLDGVFELLDHSVRLTKSQRDQVVGIARKHYDAVFETEQNTVSQIYALLGVKEPE